MSQTYGDAIHMTRAPGIQYLWIDVLCIIQDNHDQEKRSAADDIGVLEYHGNFASRSGRYCLWWDFPPSNGSLNRRGWTPRERLLSRSLLHFGIDQLHWGCVDPATVFRFRAVYRLWELHDLKDSPRPSMRVLSMWDQSTAHERAVVSAWRRFKENIVWGLAISDKLGALMWSVKRGTQVVPERAPSWSWVAVDGEIEF
ncbi:hypothetical protein F5X99DRAFT_406854 [Biscogniauxia marginata]|nr:hypothetical protein F5X99DRAFT_406854 [Biscogniauxia marginata]